MGVEACMQVFPAIYGFDRMLAGNMKCWKNHVILSFHFLWISPYTNYGTCNKAICHPYWVIRQTGIENLCWDTMMNDSICLLSTYGWNEKKSCDSYHIIRLFMRPIKRSWCAVVVGSQSGLCRGVDTEQGTKEAEGGSACVLRMWTWTGPPGFESCLFPPSTDLLALWLWAGFLTDLCQLHHL